MSYLIENSNVVSKIEYEDNIETYLSYSKYEIDDYYILTTNEKPFFSIFDIANFCKKKYKDSKLFLIAHKYFDNVKEESIVEFYMFNTINIFEKSLTSLVTISKNDLIKKQKMLYDNIFIAKKLLNTDNIHIILGDNIKEHEVVEYINYNDEKDSIIIFDDNIEENYIPKNIDLKIENNSNIKTNRISDIVNKVRIIEPQSSKIKKYTIIFVVVFMVLLNSQDFANDFFKDYKYKLKKETRDLKRTLTNTKKDLAFKIKEKNNYTSNLKKLKRKDIYKVNK